MLPPACLLAHAGREGSSAPSEASGWLPVGTPGTSLPPGTLGGRTAASSGGGGGRAGRRVAHPAAAEQLSYGGAGTQQSLDAVVSAAAAATALSEDASAVAATAVAAAVGVPHFQFNSLSNNTSSPGREDSSESLDVDDGGAEDDDMVAVRGARACSSGVGGVQVMCCARVQQWCGWGRVACCARVQQWCWWGRVACCACTCRA
jgi:hypothetical protein